MGILYHFIYLDDIGTDPNQYFDSSMDSSIWVIPAVKRKK